MTEAREPRRFSREFKLAALYATGAPRRRLSRKAAFAFRERCQRPTIEA